MIARARDNAEILRNGAKYLEEKNGWETNTRKDRWNR
jgi:hypothetical protein